MGEASGRLGAGRAALGFARLKWSLLRGGLCGSTQQRVQTVLSAVMAALFGSLGALVLATLGHSSSAAASLIVVLLPVSVLGLGVLSAATGVEATIDPRHLAGEPLTRWELGLGMLTAAAVGPPALLGLLVGLGIAAGWGGGSVVGWAITLAVVVAWWATLLAVSRTAANAIGAVATGRFRHAAQIAASGAALVVWLSAQIAARSTSGWTDERWARAADVAAWTPPGQLGRALGALDRPLVALGHLALGVSWLPLLVFVSVLSTARLAMSPPRPGGGSRRARPRPAGLRSSVLGRLPWGPVGTMIARTLTTKLRTPRQSVNTATALLVGAGAFLIGPIVDGSSPDPRFVLVSGLLHFAVLFDGNNAFGMDGPALWIEVASGADARVLIRSKLASSILVMAIPAAVLPVVLAAMSGGWAWVPAAWLLAAGSLLAAGGVAVASASLAPVALPDSPNPLAAGDTGQGCLAGLMLAAGMAVLIAVSAPVGILVALASSSSVALATIAALTAPVAGAAVAWGGSAVARARLVDQEAELIERVTPAR